MEAEEQKYEFTLNVPGETPMIRHRLWLKMYSSGKLHIVDEAGWSLAYFAPDGKLHLPRGVPLNYPRDDMGHIAVEKD